MSYVAGLKRGWKEGLAASLTFSLARIPAYLLLGALVAYFGTRLHEASAFHHLQSVVQVLTGVLLIAVGVLLTLFAASPSGCCRVVHRLSPVQNTRFLVGLGFLYGLSPCVPMVAVMARVGLQSTTIAAGAACMAIFGVGTVLSPLLVLGAGSGMFAESLARRGTALSVFRRACGLLLCYSGVCLIALH
jgi:sulfite exporter TauE/SafE